MGCMSMRRREEADEVYVGEVFRGQVNEEGI